MAVSEKLNELDRLWKNIPKLLDQDEGWALREVLAAGVADGTRHLVRINLDGPDTIIGVL
jgi:hypothetical protein